MFLSLSPDQYFVNAFSFNSCLIISGGGPFQWNAVGHHFLDFITEGSSELLDRYVSGIK